MRDAISQKRLSDMLTGALGADITAALQDPGVIEIMVNPDGRIWLDRFKSGRTNSGWRLCAAQTERVIRLVASHIDRFADKHAPIVSAELPETGERFEGCLPPIVAAPCFSIRKPAGKVLRLDDYVRDGICPAHFLPALQGAVASRANILVVGGTSSGKTTLANAFLAEIADAGDRVIILEDTRELQCAAEDVVQMRTRPGAADLPALIRSTLRLRPDRIIIGEVRGGEALDMLKAWNTGHPGGIATLHANSAEAGLLRLEQLIGEVASTIPHDLIADAIDLVVFITRRGAARRIETVANVCGVTGSGYDLQPVLPDLSLVPPAQIQRNPS